MRKQNTVTSEELVVSSESEAKMMQGTEGDVKDCFSLGFLMETLITSI